MKNKNQWNNWIGSGDVAKYNVIFFSIYLMLEWVMCRNRTIAYNLVNIT